MLGPYVEETRNDAVRIISLSWVPTWKETLYSFTESAGSNAASCWLHANCPSPYSTQTKWQRAYAGGTLAHVSLTDSLRVTCIQQVQTHPAWTDTEDYSCCSDNFQCRHSISNKQGNLVNKLTSQIFPAGEKKGIYVYLVVTDMFKY